MRGTFGERTRELERMVGEGTLTGKVEVDQVYALAQNSGFWRTGPNAGVTIKRHYRGGRFHFLDGPLMEQHARYMQRLADAVLDGNLILAMRLNMEALAGEVHENAPRWFDDLRNSAHPTVTDGSEVVYDRPPLRPRLSKAALREKAKRARLGEGPEPGEDVPF